jgi:hypothetical protein
MRNSPTFLLARTNVVPAHTVLPRGRAALHHSPRAGDGATVKGLPALLCSRMGRRLSHRGDLPTLLGGRAGRRWSQTRASPPSSVVERAGDATTTEASLPTSAASRASLPSSACCMGRRWSHCGGLLSLLRCRADR